MALSFKELKSKSKNIDALSRELDKINPSKKKKFEKDERFWYPELDKTGAAFSVIRFLPAPADEDVPVIRYFEYAFQGPTNAWYFERALSTFDKPDPVGEYNQALWNTGTKENQDKARKQKRKLTFIANIMVVQDKANPENEGKVFLFKFGKQIFDMINTKMFPEFEGIEKMNPFDLDEGANFRFIIKKKDKTSFADYGSSEFESPAPISLHGKKLNEKEQEAICSKLHSLQELMSPKYFKTYDELKARFEKVMGFTDSPRQMVKEERPAKAPKPAAASFEDDDDGDDINLSFLDGDDE